MDNLNSGATLGYVSYKRKKLKQINQLYKSGAFFGHSVFWVKACASLITLPAWASPADLMDRLWPNTALSRVAFLLRILGFSLIYIVQVMNWRYTILRRTGFTQQIAQLEWEILRKSGKKAHSLLCVLLISMIYRTQECRKPARHTRGMKVCPVSHSDWFAGLIFWDKAGSCLRPWKMRVTTLYSNRFCSALGKYRKDLWEKEPRKLDLEEHSLVDKLKH